MCDIYLSLCGHLLNYYYIGLNKLKEEEMYDIFENPDYLIDEETYTKNPSKILADKNLVVCIED